LKFITKNNDQRHALEVVRLLTAFLITASGKLRTCCGCRS